MLWKTSRRTINLEQAVVMGILNVTPDSFSDGGKFLALDDAIRQAEKMIEEGAVILDIGGESTRPGSQRVSADEEMKRVLPVVEEVARRFDVAISIDTTKSEVAKRAVQAGAEIINDISGLRFDEKIAEIAAENKTGLVLMHLRGSFETMHSQPPVEDILKEVSRGFRESLSKAERAGIEKEQIALDIGLGFSKQYEQNLELLAKLDYLIREFADFPMLVGPSRKSFIGKVLNKDVSERLYGTLATVAIAVWQGAKILRVHDVQAAVETIKIVEALRERLED
ncbi:MAG: dihydropteroate synthase [Acidobacteria bacterium]|jgi:dihydropteroate synthase|nr:MAG: dihydropteroate synthase [Acidobacteriota bacterium]GIU81085.1 MAG: dihydropteroate synthase [Pyrinomonadaceae bacterium]